jgi:hypothetical protein
MQSPVECHEAGVEHHFIGPDALHQDRAVDLRTRADFGSDSGRRRVCAVRAGRQRGHGVGAGDVTRGAVRRWAGDAAPRLDRGALFSGQAQEGAPQIPPGGTAQEAASLPGRTGAAPQATLRPTAAMPGYGDSREGIASPRGPLVLGSCPKTCGAP